MLTKTMNQALNDQIKWEMYSSYLYLSMCAYFSEQGLNGFAQWMRVQAQEELFHAMKFYDYVLERGGSVELQPLDAPTKDWESAIKVLEHTLEHERLVTKRINDLVDQAMADRDHATNIFLQWFVSEQVEEEDSVSQALDKLRLVGGQGGGLFFLDKELGTRVFTPPAGK